MDSQKFKLIMDKHADMVTRICILRLGNEEDAKDCFQNTFLKCYEKLPRGADEEYIKAWLIRVAINECNSFARRAHKKYEVSMEAITVSDSGHTANLEALAGVEAEAEIESEDATLAQVQKLKPDYRDVLLLHYYEDYSVKEVASILRKPENTVKTQLKRARQALKSLLLAH